MLRTAAVVLLGAALPSYVVAQKATCLAGFEWMSSSTGDTPCDVGSALGGVCVGGQFTLEPLDVGYIYIGPTATNQNSCRCSSVYYSLLSACAACQNRNFIRWSAYTPNCTTVYDQVFQNPIPIGLKVPHWAYLDVSTSDTFNATLARAAGGIESTRPAAATPTSSSSSVTATPSHTSRPKKSNAGAIAGGVVGGVVFIALLAAGLFYFCRRRNTKSVPPPITPDLTGTAEGKVYNDPNVFPAMNYTGTNSVYSPYSSPGPDMHQQSHGSHQQSPVSAAQNLPQFTGGTVQTAYTSHNSHYTGVPEL